MRLLSWKTRSRQQYPPTEISPYFIVNGYPPTTPEYQQLLEGDFAEWRMEITGLVKRPQHWSLADLRALPPTSQITKHHCIQGWSGVAQWSGVLLSTLLDQCEPLSVAHGAPLRLRVETQLGFKMVQWIRSIEVVADYAVLGDGQGGSREDTMYYEQTVGI